MTDYRELSKWEQARVDRTIDEEIEPKHHRNEHNGFEWDEPQYTKNAVHKGDYCAECWTICYNCVCGHE